MTALGSSYRVCLAFLWMRLDLVCYGTACHLRCCGSSFMVSLSSLVMCCVSVSCFANNTLAYISCICVGGGRRCKDMHPSPGKRKDRYNQMCHIHHTMHLQEQQLIYLTQCNTYGHKPKIKLYHHAGETVERIVSYQPPIPGPQSLTISCKTLAGRTFTLPATALGVQPGLSISHNKISFPATPVNDVTTVSVVMRNVTSVPQVCGGECVCCVCGGGGSVHWLTICCCGGGGGAGAAAVGFLVLVLALMCCWMLGLSCCCAPTAWILLEFSKPQWL